MKVPKAIKTGIIILILISIFIILNLSGFFKIIRNYFYSFSSPLQTNFWMTKNSVTDFFDSIRRAQNLKPRIDDLSKENEELKSQIVGLEELKTENQTLRDALNMGLEKDFQLELAQIVSKDISKDSILINKGSKDGMSKGFPVITSQKILLGKVGEVYPDFSEVILITNSSSSFDVEISDKEIYGLVKGEGNHQLYLDLVPKEKELMPKDIVVSSVLGGIFPKGLLVGEVSEITKKDVEPFQKAEIKPYFDLNNLENLFIITNF